ncbi:hypothetical protein H6P81_017632 [Aristolochia fimbriata]|uniref:Uncharacterized protein n=1 Tax=Aristolochia fimbriata TaxID=158543 RepID=A0AAV7DZG4_ARIFI|nr:hypothetical protein H6P81_017632 [Aristolochia fimbriata]
MYNLLCFLDVSQVINGLGRQISSKPKFSSDKPETLRVREVTRLGCKPGAPFPSTKRRRHFFSPCFNFQSPIIINTSITGHKKTQLPNLNQTECTRNSSSNSKNAESFTNILTESIYAYILTEIYI